MTKIVIRTRSAVGVQRKRMKDSAATEQQHRDMGDLHNWRAFESIKDAKASHQTSGDNAESAGHLRSAMNHIGMANSHYNTADMIKSGAPGADKASRVLMEKSEDMGLHRDGD